MALLTEAITASLPGPLRTTDRAGGGIDLTEAQIDLLRLIAAGLSNAEIARIRSVEEGSIVRGITRLSRRLGIKDESSMNTRVALARWYYALSGVRRSPRVG